MSLDCTSRHTSLLDLNLPPLLTLRECAAVFFIEKRTFRVCRRSGIASGRVIQQPSTANARIAAGFRFRLAEIGAHFRGEPFPFGFGLKQTTGANG